MKKLSNKHIETIKSVADEHFDGNHELAAAAHVHGLTVVQRCGGRIVEWFDHDAIKNVVSQVSGAKNNTSAKTPGKKRGKSGRFVKA